MSFDRSNAQSQNVTEQSASQVADSSSKSVSFSLLQAVVREKTPRNEQSNESRETLRRAWEGGQVHVRLKDILPAILQAAVDQKTWLDDFSNEELVLSKDFYEVLTTFQQIRKHDRRRVA